MDFSRETAFVATQLRSALEGPARPRKALTASPGEQLKQPD